MRRLARLQFRFARGPVVEADGAANVVLIRPRHVFAAAVLAVATTYALSPFMALWTIDSALRKHDAGSLSAHIDWSALSTNLKQQTIDAILGPPPGDDDLPDFGASFATTAVSHAIDTRLTPNALIGMATQLMPREEAAIGWAALFRRFSARFEAINRFKARVDTPDGHMQAIVHLKFEHWHWQVTRVELPTAS